MLLNNYFECKVKFDNDAEGGKIVKTSETYLVEAMNFTDAETRITEEVAPFCSGEFEVTDIKKAKYEELFMSDREMDDKWYKVKVNFITLDEKSQTEKKSAHLMLVQSCGVKAALAKYEEGMKNSMMDWDIALIQETPILDVYSLEAGRALSTAQSAEE